jgi:16S rRNA C967 or C1407 C5-methylase (RsmB/RsmF family)
MAHLSSPRKTQFWARMQVLLGSESKCRELATALDRLVNEGSGRAFRINALRTGVDLKFLEKLGFKSVGPVAWCSRGHFADLSGVKGLGFHPVIGAGLVYLQEPGAMEAVEILSPKPGDYVLDLCAAPGGKATQIGELLAGSGWLVANDPVRARAERLSCLIARHGVANASIYSLDPTSMSKSFEASFDKILVDAPCSGESLFAKRIDFRSDIRDAEVKGATRRQFLILSCAAKMLKAGGSMVYSTCTYSKEENEDMVAAFLSAHPDFTLTTERRRWPHIDNVAGGYVARLEASKEWNEGCVGFDVRASQDNKGLIREGFKFWNNEVFDYGEAMAMQSKLLQYEVDFKLAECYLQGEGLKNSDDTARGNYVVQWDGRPLGLCKAVAGRLNNLLPKILRSKH